MIQKKAKAWEFEGFEFEKGAFNYDISKPYRLWFEYLRLSPTYLLAHRHKTAYKGGLTEAQKSTLPDDFDEVLKTYDAFGDIYKYPFREWWDFHSEQLFGVRHSKFRAHPLAYIAEKHSPNKEACQSALNYFLNSHLSSYSSGYLILAVPLADSRVEIIKSINEVITDEFIQPSKIELNAPYKLHGERFHYDALETGLHLLCLRMQEPKTSLWKLGVTVGVSESYAYLDITVKRLKANMVEPTQVLENLSSRALKGATLVMENAARGKFPCKDKIAIPTLNYRYMWQIMRRQHEANEKFLIKTKALIKEGRLIPIAAAQDWEYNIPEYKLEKELYQLESRKKFIEEQLALHKERKIAAQFQ